MFRQIPPKDLVEELLHALGFTGLTDRRVFTKDSISVDVFEEFFPLLIPFYYPSKTGFFVNPTPDSCLTILRQILRPHGVSISYFERTKNRKKVIEYQLFPNFTEELSTILHIDFS